MASVVSDVDASGAAAPLPARTGWLTRLSDGIATLDSWLAGGLVCAIFCLLIANAFTRAFGTPVIWIDELAIYAMIWAAFMGSSAALPRREHIAVTLLPDALPPKRRAALQVVVDALVVVFVCAFGFIVWRWFDPLTMMAAENLRAFSSATFNFIYTEPTTTIGMRKIWFWLVMPYAAVTLFIHATRNLSNSVASFQETV